MDREFNLKSELSTERKHIEDFRIENVKLTEDNKELKQCLKMKATSQPVISVVSGRIKKMKEEESTKHLDTDMIHMMNQSEQTAELKEAETLSPVVQVR